MSGPTGASRTRGRRSGPVLEAPALVSGFDNIAMMGEAVEERGRHLGIAAKDAWPFAERQIGGNDDRGLFVKTADQMVAARLREGQVTKLVKDDEIHAAKMICQTALPSGPSFCLEFVHQIDDIEVAAASSASDAGARDCDGKMCFSGTGRSSVILPGV